MNKKVNSKQQKDQIFNPFLIIIIINLILLFLHISYLNDSKAGSLNTNPFASIEKFVIERVALF